MNYPQHSPESTPDREPFAVAATVPDGAVQEAERSALAMHQDPSLIRQNNTSKMGRGLEWVRPSDLIAAHSARLAGHGLNLQTDLAQRVRQLPHRASTAKRRGRPVTPSDREVTVFDSFDVFDTSATSSQAVRNRTAGLGFR